MLIRDPHCPGPLLVTTRCEQILNASAGIRAELSAFNADGEQGAQMVVDRALERLQPYFQATTNLPIGVRKDLNRTFRALANILASGPLLNFVNDQHEAMRKSIEDEVKPYKNELLQENLTRERLKEALTYYSGDRRKFKFEYDDADHFFDELIGYEPINFGEVQLLPGSVWYQPTPVSLIRNWIEKYPLSEKDVVIDCGSGPGRAIAQIVMQSPARGIAIDYFAGYCTHAAELFGRNCLTRANIRQEDLRESSFSDGNVFYFFNPVEIDILKPIDQKLKKLSKKKPITVVALGASQKLFDSSSWLTCVSPVHEDDLSISVYGSSY